MPSGYRVKILTETRHLPQLQLGGLNLAVASSNPEHDLPHTKQKRNSAHLSVTP